jgi:hypothetical protein
VPGPQTPQLVHPAAPQNVPPAHAAQLEHPADPQNVPAAHGEHTVTAPPGL